MTATLAKQTGRPFAEVLQQIKATHETKVDYVADSNGLTLATDKDGSMLSFAGGEATGDVTLNMTPHSFSQLRERLGMPADYTKRLQTTTGLHELLDTNVNTLLRHDPKPLLVRSLNGRCRAILSDRYQVIDNWDILATVMPEIQSLNDKHGAVVDQCDVTEDRLMLKIVLPGIEYNLGKIETGPYRGLDDLLHPIIYVQNSEVGSGQVKIHLGIMQLVCWNGLMVDAAMLAQSHVGKSISQSVRGQKVEGSQVHRLLSDETKAAEDKAFLLAIRDVMRAGVDEMQFQLMVNQFGELKGLNVPKPAPAVDVLKDRYNLTDPEGEALLNHLINGGDLSMYGVISAHTAAAQTARDFTRRVELEEIGGKMLAQAGNLHKELARL